MSWSLPKPIRNALGGAFYIFALTAALVILVSLTEPLISPFIDPRQTYSSARAGPRSGSSATRQTPGIATARPWAPVTHYETLGVPIDVEDGALRRQYLQRAKKYHPDKVHHLGAAAREEAEARFAEMKQAYEFLLHSDTRCAYDRVFLRPTAEQRERCLERQVERRARKRREEEEDRRRAVREEEEARLRAEEEEREALMAEVDEWMNRGTGGGVYNGNGAGGKGKGKKSVCDNELMIFPLNTLCRFIVNGSVGLFSWLRDALHAMGAGRFGKLIPGIW